MVACVTRWSFPLLGPHYLVALCLHAPGVWGLEDCYTLGRVMCCDLPHAPRTLAFLSGNMLLTVFPSLSDFSLAVAFQYPQLNLSQLLKSSWVRTGMFD